MRLAGVIEAARQRPFKWGEHDCFLLACAAVKALTGQDRAAPFVGTYRTAWQAWRIVAMRWKSWESCIASVFEVPAVDPRLARMGDLVLVPQQKRMPALGVCLGAEVAVPFEHQLGFVPRSVAVHAWRVG